MFDFLFYNKKRGNCNSLEYDNTEKVSDMFCELIQKRGLAPFKFLTNSIQGELNIKTYINDRCYDRYIEYVKNSFLLDSKAEDYKRINKLIEIEQTPVISTIWNIDRIKNNYLFISSDNDNKFDVSKSKYNVRAVLIQPIGLVIVYSGNHSVNSAIMHNEGEFYVTEEVNIMPILEKYSFNGKCYISTDNNKPINIDGLLNKSEPFTYSLGILYEIARKLHLNNKYK